MEEHYSGDNSREFWGIINLIDDDDGKLYELGVKLQNLEEEVLKKLNKRMSVIRKYARRKK